MGKDLHSHIDVEVAVAPAAAKTADFNGTHYDRGASPFCEAVEHVANIGASGDTLSGSVKVAIILQHGDEADDSDMAAVTDAAHVGGAMEAIASGILKTVDSNTEDESVYRVTYHGPKRYSRLRFDFTGTHTNGIFISGLNIGHHPRYMGQNEML